MEFCDFSLKNPWNFVKKSYLCNQNSLIMKLLRRKIDEYLKTWKKSEDKMPLIVKGARQVGKTASIMQFAK